MSEWAQVQLGNLNPGENQCTWVPSCPVAGRVKPKISIGSANKWKKRESCYRIIKVPS